MDAIINKRLSGYLAQSVHDLSVEHNSLNFWEEFKQWRFKKETVLSDLWEGHREDYSEKCLLSLIDHLGLDWPSFTKMSIGGMKEIISKKGRFRAIFALKLAA